MAGPGSITPGIYTPLQLIAGAGLLQNQGIAVPTALTNAVTSYNSLSLISNLMSTIAAAPSYGLSASVVTTLKSLGAGTCPALGASVPTASANTNPLLPTSEPGGFGNLVANNAAMYLGDGEVDKFCQVFQIVSVYRSTTNTLICSAVNATTYLGPTFTTMNDLITGQATGVNLAVKCLGRDLAKSGDLINLAKLEDFGTPTGLLQQISKLAGIKSGTVGVVAAALLDQGLTPKEIVSLCTPDSVNGALGGGAGGGGGGGAGGGGAGGGGGNGWAALPNGAVDPNELNKLQKKAYPALKNIKGTDLAEVLQILNVFTPNINNLADLLNLQKIFPTSWSSMTVPSTAPRNNNVPGVNILIFEPDGSLNPLVENALNDSTSIVLPSGCDELAKIIPPELAVANKVFQSSLQQIGGISTISAPRLAVALLG